jgi:glucokinase
VTKKRGVILAIDVGGTFIKCALVNLDGSVHYADRLSTDAKAGGGAVVIRVLAAATMLNRAATIESLRPLAVGLAVPGIVDRAAGVVRSAANLGWSQVNIRRAMTEHMRLPVTLAQDVRAGAVAEARIGAGQGISSFLFVPIGTGIALAHVINGYAQAGAHCSAGEIGHLTVTPRGPRCGCGRRGCLEAIASASALARRYRTRTKRDVTAADVVRLAREGDSVAGIVWTDAIAALATALTAAVAVADPARIVIGGGLAEAGEILLAPLTQAMESRLPHYSRPDISRAWLGDMAGCLGSALLALDDLHPTYASRSEPLSHLARLQ